jgi:hypothetical protein
MAQIVNSILGRQKFGTQKPVCIAGFKGNCTGRKISYICLHKAQYAPQHINTIKRMNSKELNDFIFFMQTIRPGNTYKNSKGEILPANNWRVCVDIWLKIFQGSEHLFVKDTNSDYIMPDYSKLKEY